MYKQLEVGTSISHLNCYGFGTNATELLALGPKSAGKNSGIKKKQWFYFGQIYLFIFCDGSARLFLVPFSTIPPSVPELLNHSTKYYLAFDLKKKVGQPQFVDMFIYCF